jgi:hypothetical protein
MSQEVISYPLWVKIQRLEKLRQEVDTELKQEKKGSVKLKMELSEGTAVFINANPLERRYDRPPRYHRPLCPALSEQPQRLELERNKKDYGLPYSKCWVCHPPNDTKKS